MNINQPIPRDTKIMATMLNRTSRFTLLCLVLALTACSKTTEQHIELAQAALKNSDHDRAVIELKNALQQQPTNAEARFLLGEALHHTHQFASAEKELYRAHELGIDADRVLPLLAKTLLHQGKAAQALELTPPEFGLGSQAKASLLSSHALANLALGKISLAESAVTEAGKLDPLSADVLIAKAQLALSRQSDDEAMQWVEKTLAHHHDQREALFIKADLLTRKGDISGAIVIYERISKLEPKSFRAHLALVDLHLRQNQLEQAIRALTAAEGVAPNAPVTKYWRAAYELRRGNLKQAYDALAQALRNAPDHVPSLILHASVSYDLGHYEQSLNSAKRVLARQPNQLAASKILAAAYLQLGENQKALDIVNPLLQSNGFDAQLLSISGEALVRGKDYTEAVEVLAKAASLAPEDADLRNSLAYANIAAGNRDKAISLLEQAASLSDENALADFELILQLLQRKNFDAALTAINRFEQKITKNPVTHNLRGAALLGKNDRRAARREFETALVTWPGFYPAAFNLARLDADDGNLEAARKRFEAVLVADKNNANAMVALAKIAKQAKKTTEAAQWLEKAIKSSPASIPIHAALVQHHLGNKDQSKALAQARHAANVNSNSLDALHLLARTQAATGNHSAAVASYTRMTEKAPNVAEVQLLLGLAQIASGQSDVARRTLSRALQLKPGLTQAQDALMTMELNEGRIDAALAIARQMQQSQPLSPAGFEREGDILLSAQRYAPAVRVYDVALEKGTSTALMIKRHRALELAGDRKTANEALSAALRTKPLDFILRTYAADYYLQAGRHREAIAQYEALLDSDAINGAALNNLANLLHHTNDQRALAVAEKAYSIYPRSVAIQDTLGWILVSQGQTKRGLELLREAVKNAPELGVVRYHYAVGLAQSGDIAAARKELEQAIKVPVPFAELDDAKKLYQKLLAQK